MCSGQCTHDWLANCKLAQGALALSKDEARADGRTFGTELEARLTLPSSRLAPGHEQNHDKRSPSYSFGLRFLRFDRSRDHPARQEAVAGLGCCCGQQRGRLRYRSPDGSIRLCARQSRVHRSIHKQPVPLAVQARTFRFQGCNCATRERRLIRGALGIARGDQKTATAAASVGQVSNIGRSRVISNARFKFGPRLESTSRPPFAAVFRCISISAPRPALST